MLSPILAVHPTAPASCPAVGGAIRAAPHSGGYYPALPGCGMADFPACWAACRVVRYRAESASAGARAEWAEWVAADSARAVAADSVWVAAAGMGGADVEVERAAAWAAAVDAAKHCAGGTRVVRCNTDPNSPLR